MAEASFERVGVAMFDGALYGVQDADACILVGRLGQDLGVGGGARRRFLKKYGDQKLHLVSAQF